jgi:hypothetical protein
MKKFLLLTAFLLVVVVSPPSLVAERYMSDEAIWQACWSGDYAGFFRTINYPVPIRVTIHNISQQSWELCVFDNLCPYTLFRGELRPKHSITLTACGDNWHRGSISMMNAEGYIWFYDDTRDRTITLK